MNENPYWEEKDLLCLRHDGYCFRLSVKNRGHYLSLQRIAHPDWDKIPFSLGREIPLSERTASEVIGKILEMLPVKEVDKIFGGLFSFRHLNDSRLQLDLPQICCDYSWCGLRESSTARNYMKQLRRHLLFVMAENHVNEDAEGTPIPEDQILMVLRHDRHHVCLIREETHLSLTISLNELLGWEGFFLQKTVRLPLDAHKEILEWLCSSGVIEILEKKRSRPSMQLCVDPGFSTAFSINTPGMRYSYSDWCEPNEAEETALLNKVLQQMLSWANQYGQPLDT